MDAIHQGVQADPVVETVATAERPEWMPEKFVRDGKPDYEAMAKAYAELEKKQGGEPQPKPTSEQKPDPNAADPNGEAAKKAVEGVGLNFEEFTTEFTEKGELSAESYDKLAKAGIPKELVDSYITGQKAVADRIVNDFKTAAFTAAGGEDAYMSTIAWAKDNLNDAEKKAFNSAVNGGDLEAAKLAVAGLVERARKGGGIEPKNIVGQSPAGDSGYSSMAEVVADMQKPEYQSSPAFRAKVERKLAASKNL